MLSLFKKKNKETLPARERGNSCLNCNLTLEGNENFCPECGQRNNINQLNFKLFIDEFFGDLFSYDSRLWRTVFPLILKPGKIAYEFISGKRKKFVNPFRIYLTVSLVFFLVYGLLNTINRYNDDSSSKKPFINFNIGNDENLTKAEKDSIIDAALYEVDKKTTINVDSTLKANNLELDSITDKISNDTIRNGSLFFNSANKKIGDFWKFHRKNKELSTKEALDNLGYKNIFWNRFYYDKAKSTQEMIDDDAKGFSDKMISGLSFTIFIFLPVFALFLKLIYIRRKYTYMEHMVFIFYTQTVFFLLMLLFVIINFFKKSGSEKLVFIALGLFALYLLLAMKLFYKQGWGKTIFKYLIANFSFAVIATFGFVILSIISFLLY
ncbi:MAG: DUF3667 domain-containing protein [Flavobacteriaceae bacterium]|nr:DUF3667 domain-containing protein [Flavobacteriaceae bacterium]